MATPRKTIAGSTSKVKEKPTADETSKENQKSSATPRTNIAQKATSSDIYSQPKKRDKVGPGPVTEKNTPRLTARDIPKSKNVIKTVSSKDVSKSVTSKDVNKSVPSKDVNKSVPSKDVSKPAPSKDSKPVKEKKIILKASKSEDIKKEQRKTVKKSNSPVQLTPRTTKDTDINKIKSSKEAVKLELKKSTISKEQKNAKAESKSSGIKSSKDAKQGGRMAKDLPFMGLLVNSPPSQRKLVENSIVDKAKNTGSKEQILKTENKSAKSQDDRQRSKTRTLKDNEINLLKEGIDNNVEMSNLCQKLVAKPKAFYIDLEDKRKEETEDDYDYEDDFESYESDFESYRSSESSVKQTDVESDNVDQLVEHGSVKSVSEEINQKIDEERMLDSGNFELGETHRSAAKVRTMDGIEEVGETDVEELKKQSLNDEGFQDMSNSSAVSSLERPTFIDFSKSKENKKRRLIRERQKKRVEDLLSMISLHEVSYLLFDMKPIPYDNFMAIYGNDNAVQTASQTYDDGVDEEIQTEIIFTENKWTQHPVDFSSEIYIRDELESKSEDLSDKFKYLWSSDAETGEVSEDFKNNPLRMYLEQKNGVGTDGMMSQDRYEKMMKTRFNADRLTKFLAKTEKRLMRVLSKGNTERAVKKSKWPFSEGYVDLFDAKDPKLFILDKKSISSVAFSETMNLVLTVHDKLQLSPEDLQNDTYNEVLLKRCLICLWDPSVASVETSMLPQKFLVAVDNVAVCRFRGDLDGLVAAALDDGSIHVWDLSEAPSWHVEVSKTQSTEGADGLDRNARVTVRSSAYASSAGALLGEGALTECWGHVAGLQFVSGTPDDGYGEEKILGRLCSLHRHGLLNLWSIAQSKRNSENAPADIGKAYWSKVKLKKIQTINLTRKIDAPIPDRKIFNLSAAKKRNSAKKLQHSGNADARRAKSQRPRSAIYEISADAASEGRISSEAADWESGVICTDLRVAFCQRVERYLVAKNAGEIVCCDRSNGDVRLRTFQIACDGATITSLELSPSHPLLLAGGGARVHLFSLLESRTLLSLDCGGRASLRSVHWPARDPCSVLAVSTEGRLVAWDLARSDVSPVGSEDSDVRASDLERSGDVLAIVTSSGAVEIHRLTSSSKPHIDRERLFANYVALL